MISSDLAAWLGPVADDATPDQLEEIAAAAALIRDRYPHPDLADDREAALTGATQVVIGDSTLEDLAAVWSRCRQAEMAAHATLTGAIIASRTLPETGPGSLCARTGMARQSVRKALGK